MQENKKSIMLQKVGSIALLCLFVIAFVGSIFCAMILPFANLSPGVASAYSTSYEGVLDQASSGYTFRSVPSDVTQLCAVFYNCGYIPSFSDWGLPYGKTQLFKYTYDAYADMTYTYNDCGVMRMSASDAHTNFGWNVTDDIYMLAFDAGADSYGNFFYVSDADKPYFDSTLGQGTVNRAIDFSFTSGYGQGRIVNFTSFTVNSAYIDKLVPWMSLSTSFETVAGGTIVEEVLSPEYFATRFVTPTDSPSNTVFFNLDTMPKSPKLSDLKSYSSGALSWYYYDYFQEVGTDGSLISANDVETVGWHVSFNSETSVYRVELRIGRQVIYYYDVTGSSFDTGTISSAQWNVASNFTFGDMKLYKYDFSGASSYYTLLPHEDGKVRPVDSQFGEGGWNSWLALFDLSNFVSMSNDVYINLGYQNAKTYYDELIKTKTQESFLQGKNQGYELGFQEGKLQGGNYTFTSLIGAVFDAPIEAFRGLFNFEILGTNMQGFVLALLTLSVIIVVIKFALGGK